MFRVDSIPPNRYRDIWTFPCENAVNIIEIVICAVISGTLLGETILLRRIPQRQSSGHQWQWKSTWQVLEPIPRSHTKNPFGGRMFQCQWFTWKGRCFPKYAKVRIKCNKYDKEVFTKTHLWLQCAKILHRTVISGQYKIKK